MNIDVLKEISRSARPVLTPPKKSRVQPGNERVEELARRYACGLDLWTGEPRKRSQQIVRDNANA